MGIRVLRTGKLNHKKTIISSMQIEHRTGFQKEYDKNSCDIIQCLFNKDIEGW